MENGYVANFMESTIVKENIIENRQSFFKVINECMVAYVFDPRLLSLSVVGKLLRERCETF